ncbi:MAG TPA: hypothetical protein VGS41_13045, partial [Chthonomonadales bacterium]|nr:hypothetical protein [Chthonomonadales bacterium]
FYCNWDDNYLYLAARTDQPAQVLFDVDAGGDGWLRGADNLEIVVQPAPESGNPTASMRLLDASSGSETPTWSNLAAEGSSLLLAEKLTNGSQVVELGIPKNVGSLVLRPGAQIGLRAEFVAPGQVITPTAPFEPHLLCSAVLVDSRAQGIEGLNPRLTISDDKCIAGETLFATLELLNQTDLAIPIRSVLWTGEGSSANALNTLREVTVAPVPGLKRLDLHYKTVLPPDLPTGSYTLEVTADTPDGRQVQSAASFSVVEPIQAQISSNPEPVDVVGQTRLSVLVDVLSSVPKHMSGSVELTKIPAGWQLEGSARRSLNIDRENGRKATRFAFKLPSTTPAGSYPVEAVVRWHGQEWKVQSIAHVVRTDQPAAASTGKP